MAFTREFAAATEADAATALLSMAEAGQLDAYQSAA